MNYNPFKITQMTPGKVPNGESLFKKQENH
ncbi:MAG: hypothetical protein ACI9FN_001029 [Saprospiraceae bacterium]|jgi:hypothetical protein